MAERTDRPVLEIHYAEEWAALYRDGSLVRVGDSYLAEEEAFAILGVRQVMDDAFMRGQTQRSGVAQTLDEVAEYQSAREARDGAAARLRAEASALLAQAEALQAQN